MLGQTDSEVLFFMLLGKMAQRCELERSGFPLEDLAAAAQEAVDEVVRLAGELCPHNDASPDNNFLTFLVTNGRCMLAHQGGKDLYVSTHKKRCPERDHCPYYAPECERAPEGDRGFVSHLIFSSEPLQGDNVWRPMGLREMVGVDWRMQMRRYVGPGPDPSAA